MPGFGVAFEDWVVDEIERPLEYSGDRSKRINNLVRVGLAAEQVASRRREWPDDIEDREQLVEDAMEFYLTRDED